MNHGIKKPRLQGKTSAHRDLLIRSLVTELIRAERIKTTPTKAKLLKAKFDRLVTHAKKNTPAGRQMVTSFFNSNDRSITRFYNIVEKNLGDRNSGYTRIFHTMPRKGDNADQVYIMLVNFEAKEKKSRIQQVLEKQEVKKEKKPKKAKAEKESK